MGRRGIKEYRPAEALTLIAADRDQKVLVCPTCNSTAVARTPKRTVPAAGRITLHCTACGRSAVYLAKGASNPVLPEAPTHR